MCWLSSHQTRSAAALTSPEVRGEPRLIFKECYDVFDSTQASGRSKSRERSQPVHILCVNNVSGLLSSCEVYIFGLVVRKGREVIDGRLN